jgi:hypothetical protein
MVGARPRPPARAAGRAASRLACGLATHAGAGARLLNLTAPSRCSDQWSLWPDAEVAGAQRTFVQRAMPGSAMDRDRVMAAVRSDTLRQPCMSPRPAPARATVGVRGWWRRGGADCWSPNAVWRSNLAEPVPRRSRRLSQIQVIPGIGRGLADRSDPGCVQPRRHPAPGVRGAASVAAGRGHPGRSAGGRVRSAGSRDQAPAAAASVRRASRS